jgi:predicted PurR-regulated permease PerM
MVDKNNFKDFIIYVLIIGLFVLAGIIIYPILYAIIYGILLAYIFYPIYKFLLKRIKNEFLSAFFVCIGILIIFVCVIVLIIGTLFNQIINFYLVLQKIDIVDLVRKVLPNFISSSGISENMIASISTYITNFIAGFLKQISSIISNLPVLMIQTGVLIFTFFFGLKDGKKAIDYFRSFSILKKETEEKFIKQFKNITNSVLIGHILVGVIQGIFAGIGYYLFGVHNVILLTALTSITAIIPILGAWIIWFPVDVYLFASGNTGAALGLLIYGLCVISLIDNLIRTLIVSRRTEMNTGIVFIGMIGGLFVFGFLGLIIGPLILGYVLLVIELYRKNTTGEDIIFKKEE